MNVREGFTAVDQREAAQPQLRVKTKELELRISKAISYSGERELGVFFEKIRM